MQTYWDHSRKSGVLGFDTGRDWIRVHFKDGGVYEYTYATTGEHEVQEMTRLARNGEGLESYINRAVQERGARRVA